MLLKKLKKSPIEIAGQYCGYAMLGVFSCLYPMADCQFGYLALWGRGVGIQCLMDYWSFG